ncbi:MAG: AMP-binding protein, partial [Gaiellaceae bacterium]
MAFSPLPRSLLESTLPQAVLSQARRRPDAPAVIAQDASLTYRELADRSAAVASFLDTADTGRGPVPLLLEQGAELVATILGVLRTGRAYVPLDAAIADPRLEAVLRDLGATSVVTSSSRAKRVNQLGAQAIVVPDGATPRPSWNDTEVDADGLAYVYFTSGTTGTAKGVVDTHRNVIHNVMRYVNGLEIGPDDRLSLLQSPWFSGAVSSMFGALLSGACSFPYDIEKHGLTGIGAWLESKEITIFHSVPSIFRHAVREERALPNLRLVRLEGDRATPRDLALFRQRFPSDCTLVNGLGATECGIVRRLFVGANDETWDDETTVPIGYAVEDMDVQVEDEHGAT